MFRRIAAGLTTLLFLACNAESSVEPTPNRPPVAKTGGPYQGFEGTNLNLDASASTDPDGDELTYFWRYGDGQGGAGKSQTHAYRDEGTYTATLIVRDAHDALDSTVAEVRVTNVPPSILSIVLPTAQSRPGMPVTVQVLYSDPGTVDSLTATLNWGDGDTSALQNGIGTHLYSSSGNFEITATVRDNDGGVTTRRADHPIHIAPNHAPIAKLTGPATIREGSAAMFSARETIDPDGDALQYVWLSGDGRRSEGQMVGVGELGWIYPSDGVYTVSLIVSDRAGAADTASMTLTVENTAPTMLSILPPRQQAAGTPAATAVAATDSGSDPLVFTIHWGDGQEDVVSDTAEWMSASGSAQHVYPAPGRYWVSVTVRDNGGLVSGSKTAEYPVIVFDPLERRSIAGYEASDIGSLGGNATNVRDFNDHGQIIGSSLTASGETHPFLWANGVMRDLGTLAESGGEAERINNAGFIAGVVWTRDGGGTYTKPATWTNGAGTRLPIPGGQYYDSERGWHSQAINEVGQIAWAAGGHEAIHAWQWSPGGGWKELKAVNGYGSYPSAINEQGHIVGVGAAGQGDGPGPVDHALQWLDGSPHDLGVLGFQPCRYHPDRNCLYSTATAINESGQAVGWSTAADGLYHAVLWENGAIRDLWTGTDSPNYRQSVVISDRGEVAGSSNGLGFFWSNGVARSLGSLGGGFVDVVDINDKGMVVGTSKTANGEQHAFVWTQERGMVDLGTGPHGFNTALVLGVTYFGDIVGYTSDCPLDKQYSDCQLPYASVARRAVIWRRQ